MELKTDNLDVAKLAVALKLALVIPSNDPDENLKVFREAYELVDSLVKPAGHSTVVQSGGELVTM